MAVVEVAAVAVAARVAAVEIVPDARRGGVEACDLPRHAGAVHVAARLAARGLAVEEVVRPAVAAVQEAKLVAALERDVDVAAVLVDLAEEVAALFEDYLVSYWLYRYARPIQYWVKEEQGKLPREEWVVDFLCPGQRSVGGSTYIRRSIHSAILLVVVWTACGLDWSSNGSCDTDAERLRWECLDGRGGYDGHGRGDHQRH